MDRLRTAAAVGKHLRIALDARPDDATALRVYAKWAASIAALPWVARRAAGLPSVSHRHAFAAAKKAGDEELMAKVRKQAGPRARL